MRLLRQHRQYRHDRRRTDRQAPPRRRHGAFVVGRALIASRKSRMPRLASLLLAVAVVFLALTASVTAQDYPTKPVRMIVPFPPGGGSDVTARVLAAALSERLGRQVIVDNRAGAGGVIGS